MADWRTCRVNRVWEGTIGTEHKGENTRMIAGSQRIAGNR